MNHHRHISTISNKPFLLPYVALEHVNNNEKGNAEERKTWVCERKSTSPLKIGGGSRKVQ